MMAKFTTKVLYDYTQIATKEATAEADWNGKTKKTKTMPYSKGIMSVNETLALT